MTTRACASVCSYLLRRRTNYRRNLLRYASQAAVRRLSRAARGTIVNDPSKSFATSAQGAASTCHRSCAGVDGAPFPPSQVPRCRRDGRPHVTDRVCARREPPLAVAPHRDEDTVPGPTGSLTTASLHSTRCFALTRLRAYLCLGGELSTLRPPSSRCSVTATLIIRGVAEERTPSEGLQTSKSDSECI